VTLDTKLLKRKGTEPSCDATLDVAEITGGDIDPAFAGGISNGQGDSEGSRHVPTLTVHVGW
jgi:hypothetical protein